MIHIKIELWPSGDSTNPKPIGEIMIANISDLADISSYKSVIVCSRDHQYKSSEYLTSTIEGFPRKEFTVIDLLYRILKKAVGERNEG